MILGFGRKLEEYQENADTTVRVGGGSPYFGLACCAMKKLNMFGQVDLTCMGGPPAWQKDLAVSVILKHNPKGSILVEQFFVLEGSLKVGLTRLTAKDKILSVEEFIERTNPNGESETI